jgi:hypothetical protein
MTADGVITGWDAATNKCVPCASKPCVDCRDDYKVCKACLEQAPTPPQSDGDKPFYLTKDGKCEVCALRLARQQLALPLSTITLAAGCASCLPYLR